MHILRKKMGKSLLWFTGALPLLTMIAIPVSAEIEEVNAMSTESSQICIFQPPPPPGLSVPQVLSSLSLSSNEVGSPVEIVEKTGNLGVIYWGQEVHFPITSELSIFSARAETYDPRGFWVMEKMERVDVHTNEDGDLVGRLRIGNLDGHEDSEGSSPGVGNRVHLQIHVIDWTDSSRQVFRWIGKYGGCYPEGESS